MVTKHRADFEKRFLPVNYAIEVSKRIDLITNTIQLRVEKYISMPEKNSKLPTRALVSLDIHNMFNVFSCQQLQMIMVELFPELELFADCLYSNFGKTCVKKDHGSWFHIAVKEGFAQGCSASPVFAALVLRHILTKVEVDMQPLVYTNNSFNNAHDDGLGGVPHVLAYADNVNCLLPLQDVKPFLDSFKRHG